MLARGIPFSYFRQYFDKGTFNETITDNGETNKDSSPGAWFHDQQGHKQSSTHQLPEHLGVLIDTVKETVFLT